MGRFQDAAMKWSGMADTAYRIVIGRVAQARTLRVVFRKADFDHLSGLHYANDVDFHLHRNEYRGERLLDALQSGRLSDSLVEKSANWPKIEERLSVIEQIDEILESEFTICAFSPTRLPFHSGIEAKYLIYSERLEAGAFLLMDKDGDKRGDGGNSGNKEVQQCYFKSAFLFRGRDYRQNQTRWTVLEKTKLVKDQETQLFVHPSYRAVDGSPQSES